MNTADVAETLATLFRELVHGAPEDGAFVLNRGDHGILASLDRLSADEASLTHDGGASVAAHVEHVYYGLSLMNRWAAGENPFLDANWATAWQRGTVTDTEWAERRATLRDACMQWLGTIGVPRDVNRLEMNGIFGSVAHMAYHIGAMRQIDRRLKGPSAND
ncbi:MAG TPA: hypothetical protein DGD08_10450 [Gemmatimonas aurantiaca]|uniref:DinB family protein n=2 Tax=Gemmatimonas aurantiaca TaxID=173480 RepID=C1AD06_GEMAT|nr:hypothetical protein [Gemmatimonas aurantiaca]BAH40383.1 hypothetical protein GAU_3341 [Gemmatimonas aurantiaca T-27]HCT57607.1 hypothetical protein [Gemmatimonas aurantiaca]